jgi:sodium/hydrogen exchanger-like protein 3
LGAANLAIYFHVLSVLSGWPKLLTVVPESCCLILTGIFVGIIFYITNTTVLSPLSSTIFFFCMLPPIIFDAGFFMPNRPFFDHLGTILLFAVMGTIFNTVCIGKICKKKKVESIILFIQLIILCVSLKGISLWACGLSGLYGFQISLLETLIFSALISAVDPVAVLAVFEEIHVDKVLYIIVFGESLLNDAVTVVRIFHC